MYWIIKKVFGWIIGLIWIKKIEGLENLPRAGAFIIAANHSSYLDFISLIAALPERVYFLAAEKFYKSWFWRPLVVGTGQIRVDRNSPDKKEVYQKVFAVLHAGRVLGIFPEGTRSPDGKIGKAFTGVAKFSLGAKVPVVPVAIKGAYEIMSRHDKWPKFRKNIEIKIGRQIFFEEYYNKENDDAVLREVTDKIMGNIEKLLIS